MKGLILTHVLAYGGAAIALFNPFVGVLVFWILEIVRPQYMFAWAGVEGSFSDVVAMATITGWILKGGGNWRFGRGRALVVLFALYSVWGVLSALAATDQVVAMDFVLEQTKRATIFFLAVSLADSVARVRQLAWAITGASGYVCFELNMTYLGGMNELHEFGYGGLDNNSIAISLVTCLAPAVFLGISCRRWWQKGLALGSAVLIAHSVLLTFSRGGMLALIAAGVAAVLVIPKRASYLLVVTVAIAVSLRLAGPEVRTRFMTTFASERERDGSAQSRLELWMDCVEVIRKYPILGVGPDHFPLIAHEFGWRQGKEAHSMWLQLGAEVGVPGVLSLLLLYGCAIRRLWPLARADGHSDVDEWARPAACMVVTSLTGFLVAAQFVTIEGLETPLYIVVIAVGTLRLVHGNSPVLAARETVAPPHYRLAHGAPLRRPSATRAGTVA